MSSVKVALPSGAESLQNSADLLANRIYNQCNNSTNHGGFKPAQRAEFLVACLRSVAMQIESDAADELNVENPPAVDPNAGGQGDQPSGDGSPSGEGDTGTASGESPAGEQPAAETPTPTPGVPPTPPPVG